MFDILIVEDNIELADITKKFVEKEGFTVYHASSGEEAINFWSKDKAKLVLLDIMLSNIDGFQVCHTLRADSNVPIIILSAKVEKEDKMNGFSLGADDYIEKPIDIDLLLAKIQALMKRNYEWKKETSLIRSGEIEVNRQGREMFLSGKKIPLNVKEYELMLLFIENTGKTLHKDYIFANIWGNDSESENQTLTVHVKMLRDKIEENPKQPKRIQTVWGVGYRYEEV